MKSKFALSILVLILMISLSFVVIACENVSINNADKTVEAPSSSGDSAQTTSQNGADSGNQPSNDSQSGNVQVEKKPPSVGLAYELKEDDTYEVVGVGTWEGTDLVIPDTHEGKAVTSIGEEAFFCTDLTSITISDGVADIGAWSFCDCDDLISVSISATVERIEEGAFDNCSGLTSITIPYSVRYIGGDAFACCDGLTSVVMDDGVTDIEFDGEDAVGLYYSGVFCGCKNLSSVKLPKNMTEIGVGMFSYCTSLTSITIPNGVTTIKSGAFAGSGLISVVIPDSVTTIEDYAFYCRELLSVTLGRNVTEISSTAFQGCWKLVEVYNRSLLSITKESGIAGANSFNGIRDVYTDDSVSKLITDNKGFITYADGEDRILMSYIGSDHALTLPDDITEIDFRVSFLDRDKITSIIIPNSVKKIGVSAFYDCDHLTSVTLGTGLTEIGDYAFDFCPLLWEVCNHSDLNITKGSEENGYVGYYAKEIYTEDCAGKFTVYDDGYIVYNEEGEQVLVSYFGPNRDDKQNLVLPNGVTVIEGSVFHNVMGATISIPDSVTTLRHGAFADCYFSTLEIGRGVVSIEGAIIVDSGIWSIVYRGTMEEWLEIEKADDWAVEWNDSIRAITIHCTDGDIDVE